MEIERSCERDEKESSEVNLDSPSVRKSIDRYGFLIDNPTISPSTSKEIERTKKWVAMLKDWDRVSTTKDKLLQSRLRKGIPDPVRGEVWKRLSGVEGMTQLYPNRYNNPDFLCNESVQICIDKDIPRIFRRHELFLDSTGPGTSALRRILESYASFDPECGYCSGMGLIAGTLLIYLPEDEAFYAFLSLFQVGCSTMFLIFDFAYVRDLQCQFEICTFQECPVQKES